MFFDVAKYLLTTIAVGSFVVEDINFAASAMAIGFSVGIIVLGYYITPPDKEK